MLNYAKCNSARIIYSSAVARGRIRKFRKSNYRLYEKTKPIFTNHRILLFKKNGFYNLISGSSINVFKFKAFDLAAVQKFVLSEQSIL